MPIEINNDLSTIEKTMGYLIHTNDTYAYQDIHVLYVFYAHILVHLSLSGTVYYVHLECGGLISGLGLVVLFTEFCVVFL